MPQRSRSISTARATGARKNPDVTGTRDAAVFFHSDSNSSRLKPACATNGVDRCTGAEAAKGVVRQQIHAVPDEVDLEIRKPLEFRNALEFLEQHRGVREAIVAVLGEHLDHDPLEQRRDRRAGTSVGLIGISL